MDAAVGPDDDACKHDVSEDVERDDDDYCGKDVERSEQKRALLAAKKCALLAR